MRLVVGVIDGDRQPLRREPPLLRHELPGKLDRTLLEIVAEAEVSEHLEERVMPGRIADVVEIVMLAARADALLARRGGRIRPRFEPGEYVLERHHAGVDEHQRRIVVRHQRGRSDARVPLALEIVEERAANVVGRSHGRRLGGSVTVLKRVPPPTRPHTLPRIVVRAFGPCDRFPRSRVGLV